MSKIEWKDHQELVAREEVGESIHFSADGTVTREQWACSLDPEEAVLYEEIEIRANQPQEQLELPL